MGNAASIGRAIREDISKTLSNVMLLARVSVTNATPVDTTNAANNWILSVGSPHTGVDGSRQSPSHAAQDAGDEKIRNYDVGRDGKIFLTNWVFYLQFLIKGSSQQAPANFHATAFQEAARLAPHGRKTAVRKMLRNMAKKAYLKTY